MKDVEWVKGLFCGGMGRERGREGNGGSLREPFFAYTIFREYPALSFSFLLINSFPLGF